MVTEIAPVTFQYSHTIGRSESRSGNGFFNPVAITHDAEDRLYVLSRGTETPAFYPCKRVTVFTLDEDMVRDFGHKYHPEEAIPGAPDGGFMWPTSVALDSQGNAYVADEWMQRITFFDKDGNCQGSWGKGRQRRRRVRPPIWVGFRQRRQPIHGGQSKQPYPGVHQRR